MKLIKLGNKIYFIINSDTKHMNQKHNTNFKRYLQMFMLFKHFNFSKCMTNANDKYTIVFEDLAIKTIT